MFYNDSMAEEDVNSNQEVQQQIIDSVYLLESMGLAKQASMFEGAVESAYTNPPEDLDPSYESENPKIDAIFRVENRIITLYVEHKVKQVEKKREESKNSAFSQLTLVDQISDCCYKRALKVLFADPSKPNRIIFDRYDRKADALAIFVELDNYMKGTWGYDLANAQEAKCWPIIEACLKELGIGWAWGANPLQPWEGGGRSAAEASNTKKNESGGLKA